MNEMIGNTQEILSEQVCGLHQIALGSSPRVVYVGGNLCALLGAQQEELVGGDEDRYARFVHPADRQAYSDFMDRLSRGEQTLSAQYRLVKKDGDTLCVRDTVSVRRTPEGELLGTSVLCDITALTQENDNLRFLNETIPCGFMKYTCEMQPRITYINQKMIELLRFPRSMPGELDYLEMYKSNIFLMIPMEERRRFSKFLNRVFSSEAPVAGEMALLRCDGTRAHIFGWVTKATNEQGEPEFQSVCMDITERYHDRKASETKRYIKALCDVYDKIFEFNLDANTVKCLHCEESSSFKRVEGIAVQIEDAMDKWLLSLVDADDRDRVRGFFADFCQKRLFEIDARPPQIAYAAHDSQGALRQYSGIFIRVDDSVSFYCCRRAQGEQDAEALRTENDQLKEGLRDLAATFSDGMAAFEVTPKGQVRPLYASENICEFFGYTQEEWMDLTRRYTPVESFTAYSEVGFDRFAALLRDGEAEFTYFDYKTETERRMKAICSQKEADSATPRYVMLYAMDDAEPRDALSQRERSGLRESRTVNIRTFGYFDVFVGDRPIAFRNKKSKELFALLVDRRGGYVTSEEAIGFLWEDEPVSTVTLARYRKTALRLKNTLEEYGIADVVEAVDGKRRIVMERVTCDLYQYLSGKEEYAQLFKGSYLTNYSWGETTLGELTGALDAK